jgi:hypothetical protein
MGTLEGAEADSAIANKRVPPGGMMSGEGDRVTAAVTDTCCVAAK